MSGEGSGWHIPLEHYIYGVRSGFGYGMKAYSEGVDIEKDTALYRGMYLPIRQSDSKYLKEIRSILSPGSDYILFSRIIKGPDDEYGRATMANHTVIVPRHYIKEKILSYEAINQAMKKFESEKLEEEGNIPPLVVPASDTKDLHYNLKDLLPEETFIALLNHYLEDEDRKVFLLYRRSNAEKRIRIAYAISYTLDINMEVKPLSIFTDFPHPNAKKVYNLIISPAMIDIKPGGDWVMLNVDRKFGGKGRGKHQSIIENAVKMVYGD